MYISQEIADRIKTRAKEMNVNIGEILTSCDLGINTVSKIAKGTDVLTKNFAKIADALDCSVDYLLGRTTNPISHRFILGETMTKITSRLREIMHIRYAQLKEKDPKEKYGATYWSIRSKDKIKPGRIVAFIDASDIPNHEENILLSEILDVAPDWLSGESEKIPPVVLRYRVEHPEEYDKDIVYIASKSLTNERDSYIEKDDETFDVLYSAKLDKKNVK